MEALESKTELFTMSVKELSRLDYIRMFFEKRLNQAEISEKLGISIRQVQRLIKKGAKKKRVKMGLKAI